MDKKAIIMVIDGLGIGSMEDSKDKNANTLKTILNNSKQKFNVIDKLINGDIKDIKEKYSVKNGKMKLGYLGADSLLSHLEMVNVPNNNKGIYLNQFREKLKEELGKEHLIREFEDFLWIDNKIFVSNNIEGELGVGINVLGDLELIDYDKVKEMAYTIAKISNAPKILAMAARHIEIENVKNNVEKRKNVFNNIISGIVVAKLGIYKRDYRIQNIINYDNNSTNLINTFLNNNEKVFLLGKTADFFASERTINMPEVNTLKIINNLIYLLKTEKRGLFFTNIQELDLAGHSQNVNESIRILSIIDNNIMDIVNVLNNEDILLICADHGNDPCIGHSYHTREYVPLVIIGKNIQDIEVKFNTSLNQVTTIIKKYYFQ